MSEHSGQDSGTLRVTIREAASRLGVTEGAIRKRLQRGSLRKEMSEEGRVYVYLPASYNESQPESQSQSQDQQDLAHELVDAKDAHIASLEKQLESERQAHSEARRLLAAALERIPPQLEAPAREQEATQQSEEGAESTAERTTGPPRPTPGPERSSEGDIRRPWWRRVFGR